MHETALVLDSYRAASEDRAEVIETGEAGTVVLVVADGVGGRENGGPAAQKAVGLVREAVSTGADARRLGSDARAWHRLLTEIDRALFDDLDAGETTLAAVCVTPRRIVGASVGDSEAWLVTAGGHFDLTGAQVRKPYLGSGAARPVPFALNLPPPPGNPESPSSSAAVLLMATDGLFKYAPPERILDTATTAAVEPDADLNETARRLAELARSSGSGNLYDDIAVLLCRPHGGPIVPSGGKDASGGENLAARLRRRLLPRREDRSGGSSGESI